MSTLGSIKSAVGHALRRQHRTPSELAIDVLGLPNQLLVASSAFGPGGPIPVRYTDDGESVSPPLMWADLPDECASIALLCEDPDAPSSTPFVHWLVYGMPPWLKSLPEGVPQGAPASPPLFQGRNARGNERYDGPAPPRGDGVHHYHYQVFALDYAPCFESPPSRDDLLEVMRGHVLVCGDGVGTYKR